jgi:hypothetical protein
MQDYSGPNHAKFTQGKETVIHAVSIAASRGTEPPRQDYPPIQLYRFLGEAFMADTEVQNKK